MHRAFGIVVAVVTLVLAHALRKRDRRIARTLAGLALAAPLAGVAAILAVPSLPLTVLHNACAALLVAALAAAVARADRPGVPVSETG
jgi:heme A synthase